MPARRCATPARRSEHRPLASRPGWRVLSLLGEGFDSTGDKVIEFDSAVLVKVDDRRRRCRSEHLTQIEELAPLSDRAAAPRHWLERRLIRSSRKDQVMHYTLLFYRRPEVVRGARRSGRAQGLPGELRSVHEGAAGRRHHRRRRRAARSRRRQRRSGSTGDGGHHVQDGPFADTKEQLAGFFIIDVPDIDAALKWAARYPGEPGGASRCGRPAAGGSRSLGQDACGQAEADGRERI